MRPKTRRRLIFLAGFAVYFAAIWLLWDTPLVYPLKIFVVLLHEVSHGAVAVVTGGRIERIVLDPNQGGACHCPGGSAFLTLSAGYLGSLAWGAVLLLLARARGVRARWVTAIVGGSILALTAFYLRGVFAVAFGIAAGLSLGAAARWLSPRFNREVVRVLGLTSCLYALLDIKSDVLDRPHLASDAAMLASLTGVPTILWGILWIAVALGVSGWLLRREWEAA